MSNAASPLTVIKRKRSEADFGGTEQRVPEPKSKRPKVATLTSKSKTQAATKHTHAVASNATTEFPNGFFYCHQCNKKRDSSVGLYCTYKIKTSNTVARCKAKYCRPCLKNRYGQSLDEIKDRGIDALSNETASHDKAQGYIFKCPRCLGNCNCRGCRKAVGLEPTGNLTLVAKKTGADSVAVMLDSNVKMIGILPGKGRQILDAPDAPNRRKVSVTKVPLPVSNVTASKSRPPVKYKPRPLPKVLWAPVPVPPSFTLDRALPRIAIREFVVRFGKILDMSRTHLEELEEIGGRRSHDIDDDDDNLEQDIDVEMGWVGETCLRAIFLGLLNLLLNDQPEFGGKEEKKALRDAIQEIKSSRANLSRIWGALAALRTEFARVDNKTIFPDPLPPPQHTKIHTTRSGALNSAGMNITATSQLVPVVLPLIEMVLEAQAVRDEFEEGAKETKERAREEKEQAKAIREQWEGRKQKNNLNKAARMEYKQRLNALEQAQRVVLHVYAPRFAPLGTDHEGRIYFALTPSVAEREAAGALLAGDIIKGGKAQGRAIVSTDERSTMRRWGWFVAVWGKKPADGLLPEDDDDDDDVERWWGIWQPDEIRRLADWIAIRNGIAEGKHHTTEGDDRHGRVAPVPAGRERSAASSRSSSSLKTGSRESRSGAWSGNLTPLSDASDTEDEPGFDSSLSSVSGAESDGEPNGDDGKVRTHVDARHLPSQNELKTLVKALIEYAEVLEWRVWRMQEEHEGGSKENRTVKDKDNARAAGGPVRAISPTNFYGPTA
ncbi:hypothetical protein F5148DRAFT_975965 [Russula earlei]|uniref:Uncharacterized protein n=1 Tax=Russula earlei TaxID=71964 RepID=A0ACC0UH23_9AGAM|nr:hypothetical protein F5148DRAFT_975965 [Russula earlei]